MELSIITSENPQTLSKKISLDNQGGLVKTTSAQLIRGQVKKVELSEFKELSNVLSQLSPNQALCFGITKQDNMNIVTKQTLAGMTNSSGYVARTNDYFDWPKGKGVMMLDYDPTPKRPPLDEDSLLAALDKTVPEARGVEAIWFPSSSSLIYNGKTNDQLSGIKGQRIYIPVLDASDIPRAGKVIAELSWLAGYGHYEIGIAGQYIERPLFDSCVWQPNRLDFAAGAVCEAPLEQRRGLPKYYEGEDTVLDTRKLLPDISEGDKKKINTLKEHERERLETESEEQRECYLSEKSIKHAGANATDEELENSRTTVAHALNRGTLTGDFQIHLESGDTITVSEILTNPQKYHGKMTLDPIEPEYNGDSVVGKLFLSGTPKNLYSFAHGGKNYQLLDEKRRIEITSGGAKKAVEETLSILHDAAEWFDLGDLLVQVTDSVPQVMNEDLTIHHLAGIIQYYKVKKIKGISTQFPIDPPSKIVKPLLAMKKSRGLKPLNAIIDIPTLKCDGSLLIEGGYDPESRLLLITNEQMPGIPNTPSTAEVKNAVEFLMQPFRKFDFCSEEDKSALLAALISAPLRPALNKSPAFGFDAPVQGSGKTLLASCVGALALGRHPVIWAHVRSEEEIRKRIFSAMKASHRVLIWDNVMGDFDSVALAAMLTSTEYTDRILGQSDTTDIPNKLQLIFTGNNLSITGDLLRRTIITRIDTGSDSPRTRSFDFCPLKYVLDNRQKMIAAALTIVRGWLSSDDYLDGIRAKGAMASFEDWDNLVRQSIVWVSRTIYNGDKYGDVMNLINTAQYNDPEEEAWGGFLVMLYTEFKDKVFCVLDILSSTMARKPEFDNVMNALGVSNSQSAVSVGRALSYRRDRQIRGFKLQTAGKKNNAKRYQVVKPLLNPASRS